MDTIEDLQARIAYLEEKNAHLRERLHVAQIDADQQRDFLQQVIDLIPSLIAVKDRDGRFTLANKKLADGFGVEVVDLIGKTDADFSPNPEEVEYFIQKDREAIDRGETIYIEEEPVTLADGQTRYFETTKIPVMNDDGVNDRVLLVAVDITERKAVKDRLQELLTEAERYRLMVNLSTQPLGMLNPDGSIVMANDAMYALLDVDVNTLDHSSVTSFVEVYPEDVQSKIHREVLPSVFKHGMWRGELSPRRADGSLIPTMENLSLVQDDEGQPKYIIHSITDLSEQKRQERERIRLQNEVIEAQRQSLAELSSPIIPILDGIIVMPLIGSIDTHRAREITRNLLAGISEYRAKIVILDITGVPIVDSGVADHLNKTVMAARLKGANTVITGISDAVAETIVDLGIDWSRIDTLSTLQIGLLTAMKRLGITLAVKGK